MDSSPRKPAECPCAPPLVEHQRLLPRGIILPPRIERPYRERPDGRGLYPRGISYAVEARPAGCFQMGTACNRDLWKSDRATRPTAAGQAAAAPKGARRVNQGFRNEIRLHGEPAEGRRLHRGGRSERQILRLHPRHREAGQISPHRLELHKAAQSGRAG